MRPIIVKIEKSGVILADKAFCAEGSLERVQGWLGREGAQKGEGLVLSPCSAIHTFGLKFGLDVVFFDIQGRVISTRCRLRPWRAAFAGCAQVLWPFNCQALELPEGVLDTVDLEKGDRLLVLEREG